MKVKIILSVWHLAALISVLFLMHAAVFALDSPHTSIPGYGLTCGNCHWTHASGTPPWASTVNSPDPADDTLNNRRCYACHDGSNAGIPAASTHSTSTTSTRFWSTLGWRTECVTCHDPHQQRQTRMWGTASYVASGPAPVTVGTWNTSAGNWTTVSVSAPLGADYTGYYFMPDRNYPYFYEVVEDTTGKATFKVKGSVNAAYVRTGGYAFVYGKNVRDFISYLNPGGATVGGTVKLFRPGGANGPADAANTTTSVCRVCHTQGAHWSTIGDTSHNNLTICSSCHKHMAGFRALCIDCHGGPPVVDSPLPTTGLVWATPTGSATAGAHATHVNSKGIACSACHYNSVSSGPTHNSGKITIGFYNFGGASQGGSYDGQNTANYDATTTSPATSVSNSGSKTCSNVYCHGASMAPNGGTNTTPVWNSPATGACGTCHGATATSPPTRGSHQKHTGSAYEELQLACTVCHSGYSLNHLNGRVDWSFDATTYSLLAGARYMGAAGGSATPVPSSSYSTCIVYCHSNVQSSPPGGAITYAAPKWGNNGSIMCGACHKHDGSHMFDSTTMDSGSHARHLAYDLKTGGSRTFKCVVCHKWNPSAALTDCNQCHLVEASKHANFSIDINFDATFATSGLYNGSPAPVSKVPGTAYGNCANTYCHSNGTSVSSGAIPANTSPNWGAGSLACNSCHSFPPDYTNGSPKANSHSAHAGKACNYCHASTTSDGATITGYTAHVNKSYDLQPGSGISFSYSYSTAGGTCSAISCHNSGNATWGANACNSCHGAPPATGAHITHFGGTASEAKYGDDGRLTDDPLKYKFNCGNCHPMDRAKHANGTVDVELYNASAAGFKTNNPSSASRTGTGTATICNEIYCHSNGADGANRAYRSTPQWGSTFSNNKCAGCHDDPPQYTGQSHYTQDGFMGREGGHLVGIHFDNIKSGTWGLIPQGGLAGSGAAHGDPNTATTISCNICHAATVVSAGQQSAPGTPFACANCHGLPQPGSIADKTMHVNGVRDVVFMSGVLRSKAQLGDDSFTSILQPLGWTRNNGYKLAPDSHDSITFSGSYNAGSKTCVTACHLNQPAIWGDTTVTCISCHQDL